MAKGSDEIKIQEAIHDYRLATAEGRDDKSLAKAAYAVAEAYADAGINHTSWRDERRARKWIRKAERHSPRLAYEKGWTFDASSKLKYLQHRRIDRYFPDWLMTFLVFAPAAIVTLFAVYGVVASILK